MDHGAPLAGALTLKRLREAGAAAEAFEPGLSLTQAACYYQAGMPGDCRQVLVELKRRLGETRPATCGARRRLGSSRKAMPPRGWPNGPACKRMAAAVETDQWAMFRGDASRNASTAGHPEGTRPLLNVRWRVPGDRRSQPWKKPCSSSKPIIATTALRCSPDSIRWPSAT